MEVLSKQSDCPTDKADDKQNNQNRCNFLSLYLQPVCEQCRNQRQEARENLIHDFTKLQRTGLHFNFQNSTNADVFYNHGTQTEQSDNTKEGGDFLDKAAFQETVDGIHTS